MAVDITIINPDAETGDTSGWTVEVGALTVTTKRHSGSWGFWPGANASTIVKQQIDLLDYDLDAPIIAEGVELTFGGWVNSWSGDDDKGRLLIRYHNSAGVLLDTTYSNYTSPDIDFIEESVSSTIPAESRYVNLCIEATRVSGSDNNFYWDDLYAFFVAQVETPVIVPVSGSYNLGQLISITCPTPLSTIYYTTDCSDPSALSTEYTSSFELSSEMIVKSFATVSGYLDSNISSNTYTLTPVFIFTGYVQTLGMAVERVVNLYLRSTGELVNTTNSNSVTGYFELESPYEDYHFVNVLPLIDDGYNIIVQDKIHPTL